MRVSCERHLPFYKKILLIYCLSIIISSVANASNDSDSNNLSPNDATLNASSNCQQTKQGAWVDRMQAQTYSGLCKTVRWIDGLFGDDHAFDSSSFRGKLIIGLRDEENESIDPKVRLRIKSDLPNLSKRFKGFIRREENDDFIRGDNRGNLNNPIEPETISRNSDDETSWLIGLGYKRFPDKGFSFSVGGKFRSGLQPYAKIKHRYLSDLKSPHYLAFNQLAFIEKEDGYGFSTSFDYSYELNDNDILRWGSGYKYTEELREWEASSSVTWFHRIGDHRGLSLRGFLIDTEESQVSIPEYGLSLAYRQPLHRDWLRLKLAIENRWVKETPDENRESLTKLGVEVEMLFGKHSNNRY